MHLILTGATGLVGAAVLDSMLAQETISRISILSRRPVKMAEGHKKAKVIIHNDFKTYDKSLLDQLKDAQGCVWALGVSQNDVNKEHVTSPLPMDLCLLTLLQKIETALLNFRKQNPNFRAYSVRPGGVDWTAHPEIQPFIPSQPAWKGAMVAPMNLVYKSMMTPTKPMGEVFTKLAMSNGEPLEGTGVGLDGTLLKNVGIRRMSGL
ncbi:hypothetical protein EKO04_009775 [Ascochyta lentis]|uniref:NAD(P)-binding domain-containing protein n=1 Tax=Ascochyta lentis TaxID=205686 RepID=A0A8H7MEW0_9PLEO|nr:hypothetical protein EKO04_009775 [Ascochyta lentis]